MAGPDRERLPEASGVRPTAKVMHVTEASLGGVARYLTNVAQATRRLGWLETVLVYSPVRADVTFTRLLEEVVPDRWAVVPVPMTRSPSPASDASALRSIMRAMRFHEPDILHCHSSKAGALGRIASVMTRDCRPARLYSPHALAPGRFYGYVERALGRWGTDCFVAVSDTERQQIEAAGLTMKPVHVVSPFVDDSVAGEVEHRRTLRERARKEMRLEERVPVVLGIGRFTTQKDPEQFVRVLAGVKRAIPDVVGVWLGDEGPLRDQVVALAGHLDIGPGLRILSWREDVASYLCAADVFLSTSRFESFGYATAEAMALRVPVIASRVVGTLDLITDGRTGRLFDKADTEGASELVTAALRGSHSVHDLAAEAALDVASRFSPAVTAAQLERTYTWALDTPR